MTHKTTLYVTDMDGTLLNNGSFVSDTSASIISDLSANGALITVATARTPATVHPLMADCHTRVPYIVMTGAATFNPVDMSYDSCRLMTHDDARLAIEIVNNGGINPFVYHLTDDNRLLVYHAQQMTEKEREFYLDRCDLRLKHFTFEPQPQLADNVALLFANGPTEQVKPLAEALEQTERFNVSCYPDIFSRGISLLEVFTRGVSKASTVEHLARQIGADRVVVFGDNLNDLSMFEVADVAIAVGNAFAPVKAAADIVIGPNYDDAVARYIRDDFYAQ
jgi:hypothetical protein